MSPLWSVWKTYSLYDLHSPFFVFYPCTEMEQKILCDLQSLSDQLGTGQRDGEKDSKGNAAINFYERLDSFFCLC